MSRVSNNNSIANSARTSPRIDPTTSNQVANRAPLNFNVQKRNLRKYKLHKQYY